MTIYFISGHTNLAKEEFKKHYKEKIDSILKNETNYNFVIGNSEGADAMSLDYLLNSNCTPSLITIYYFENNYEKNEDYYKKFGVNIIKGFNSYDKRDSEMTKKSDKDIAWIRPKEENIKLFQSLEKKFNPNRISGTEKNLIRRKKNFIN